MGLDEFRREQEERIKPAKDLAQEIYMTQLKGILNIKDTDGYKEIKDYWDRVKEGANEELKTTNKENLEIVQMKYRIANDFITFLNNLESAKLTRQKASK